MSTAEVGPHPLLDHAGAWTEEAYLALPANRRVELVDGSLLVAPSTDEWHDRAVAAVRAAVAEVLPDGLEVSGPVALRLSPGRILVPDLIVAAPRTADEDEVRDSSVALVVIDVVGRGNGVADRWFKPQLYAGSRIPYAVLIDHDEPFGVGSMLIGGRYHEYAHAGAGQLLRLEEPFVLDLDLRTLLDPPTVPAGSATADPGRDDAPEHHDDGPDDQGPDGEGLDGEGLDGEGPDGEGPDGEGPGGEGGNEDGDGGADGPADPVDPWSDDTDPAGDGADPPRHPAAGRSGPGRPTARTGGGTDPHARDDGADPLSVRGRSSHALDDDHDAAEPEPDDHLDPDGRGRLRVVDREPRP